MSGIFSYNKITPEIISEIESKIGAHNVSAEAEKLESYSHDEVPANAYEREYRASLLVFPARCSSSPRARRTSQKL